MLHYITTMMTSIFIIWELEPSSPFCFWRFGLHLGFSFRHTLGFAQMDCAKIFDFCKNFILYFLSNLGFDLAYQPSLPKCWSKCESISSLEPFHWIFGFGTCHLCALFYFQHFSFKEPLGPLKIFLTILALSKNGVKGTKIVNLVIGDLWIDVMWLVFESSIPPSRHTSELGRYRSKFILIFVNEYEHSSTCLALSLGPDGKGLYNWSKNSIKVSISNPSSCHPTIDASFYKK